MIPSSMHRMNERNYSRAHFLACTPGKHVFLFCSYCNLKGPIMLRLVSLVVVATWLSAGMGMAQTPPLQPVPSAPAASGEAVKLARATCRSDAEAKGLAGKARREAVRDCMRGKFPDSEVSRRAASGQTRDGRPTAKAAREACKGEVEGKSLKGAERKAAMAACFKGKRPDLAARADCRKDAKAKGLEGEALKSAVKACAKS
jgi:hypothetical protein